MPKCDFSKVRHGCSSVNLMHIFRTPFPKNTSEGLFLHSYSFIKITLFYIAFDFFYFETCLKIQEKIFLKV